MLRIATISEMSPLQEAMNSTEAVDKKTRETITQMSEAMKTMGRVIERYENENKQLKKQIANAV